MGRPAVALIIGSQGKVPFYIKQAYIRRYICNTGNERSAGCTANSFSMGSALEKIRHISRVKSPKAKSAKEL